MAIYKGDDTGAFGNQFITIDINNPKGLPVTKAEVYVNGYPFRTYPMPNFPIYVNFTTEETLRFNDTNVMNMRVWDSQNRSKQCNGSLTFKCKNGVVYNVRRKCC